MAAPVGRGAAGQARPAHEGLMLLAHDGARPVQVPGQTMAAVLEAGHAA